ncbi:conserved Plasmodium protein, unknown function [Plasmodium knowlesi strain H]|uniref:Uncharacterized protein n=3 Tax=Plasmodium knowlesi TaxID=5850 RepID=A0A5K1URD5_PLAKH|nr:conserved Plasmodium protein, unknown function [Plasmodium knowlesi strain H]OTN65830.1 Uncharacterized protein PKNOH_S100045700 [Plasmodium knowlesi]CAA9987820.1 conserved Plasmodium protein, unknown function [Plasmodium knowlesi strain H]SBO22379.1 conserved Plasmodium protein, unknown function [Plasmodium knowlesi strain H]SBO29510.1 conserved Plasmodium protein, unknown function [Plasmodium knowlesi strain H]VVS77294.1 conserved Plasmodium protein, unknown function [Plasmodium knowlesi |eukprot:XP_002258817.1 hypothetical protein, conserved in Plasmodium species [Plasmodium knowlesi strain H]
MSKGKVAETRRSKMNNKRKNYNPNSKADGEDPRHDRPLIEGHPPIAYGSNKMRRGLYGLPERTINMGGLYSGESSSLNHITDETYTPNYTVYSSQANVKSHPNRNIPMKNNSLNKWPNEKGTSDFSPHKVHTNNGKQKDIYRSKSFMHMNPPNLNLYNHSNSWKEVRGRGVGQNVKKGKMKSGEQVAPVKGPISGPIGDPIGNPNEAPSVNNTSSNAAPMTGTIHGNNLSYQGIKSLQHSKSANLEKVSTQMYRNKHYPNMTMSNLSEKANKEEVNNAKVNEKKKIFEVGKNRIPFQNKWFDSGNMNGKGVAVEVDTDMVGDSPEQRGTNLSGTTMSSTNPTDNNVNGANAGSTFTQESTDILEMLSKYLNSVGNQGAGDLTAIYKALTQNRSKESLMSLLDNIKLLEEASKGITPPSGVITGGNLVGGSYENVQSRSMDECKNKVKNVSTSFNDPSSMLTSSVRDEISASREGGPSGLSNSRVVHKMGATSKVIHPRYDSIRGQKRDTTDVHANEPLRIDLQKDIAPGQEYSYNMGDNISPDFHAIREKRIHAGGQTEGGKAIVVTDVDSPSHCVAIFREVEKDHSIVEKWKDAVAKCSDEKTQNNFEKIEEGIKSKIKMREIFKASLFCSENRHMYKNALYKNYQEIWLHSGRFLHLENIFQFVKTKEKKKEANIIECVMSGTIPFSSFLQFFNNFYEITENYQYKICFFLIYKIIIMHEDDEEYGRYYNLIIKILNGNTLIFFLLVLINMLRNYSFKMVYFVNFIERLLPLVTKGPRLSAGGSGSTASSRSSKKQNGTDKRIFFNILFLKLFRLIFYRIELYTTQKKHLLMLFLRYIKNFLLNICSSILITQYLFIKCVDLMNKYNNQQYILIKTTSMEIFLQLWNNDFLKLCILKIGSPLLRFLIFMSNVEYVNKNIFPLILNPIDNANQMEIRDAIEGMLRRNKYYTQGRKRWKHYCKKFERANKCSLLVRSYGVDEVQEVILLPSEEDEHNTSIIEVPSGGAIRTDQCGNVRTDLRQDTLLEHILQIRQSYNYYKILLSPDEKRCLNFLLQLNSPNSSFHFELFYNLFVEANLANFIHENKVIYYVEYIMRGETKVKGDEQEEDVLKGNMSVCGLDGLAYAGEEENFPIESRSYSHVEDVCHSAFHPNQQSDCIKEEEEDQPGRLKEQLLFDLHGIIQRRNCVMSKIYGTHIRLSFFFGIFFYRSYDIYRILSSSLGAYAKKFKNFKKENQKGIKFMNINNITHILTVTFLLKFLAHLGGGALHFSSTDGRIPPGLTPEEEDFFACYRLLEHAHGKDMSTANTFLNYLNNVILYLHERKRESMVLSVILTFTIYNFLTLIGKNQNRIEHLEKLTLSEICNEIHNHCLIGLLLRENNFFIDSETKFTEVEDIYSFELKNHMKFIPKDINREIFQLVHFKKYVFQRGAYTKIDIIKIGRRNLVNNLYTSEILNYIYYNTLYVLIHFVMNIRFYETIFRRTYKVSGVVSDSTADVGFCGGDGEGMCSFVRIGGSFKEGWKTEPNGKYSLTIILKKQNGDTYWRKKRYIVKFYEKAKKKIVKKLKTCLVSSNVNKFMRSLGEDKFFLNLFLQFDNSPLFFHSIHVEGSQHTDAEEKPQENFNSKEVSQAISNDNVNIDMNKSVRVTAMGMSDPLLCRHASMLKWVDNIYHLVDDINKMISFVTHRGKGRCNIVKCTFANCPLEPREDTFSIQFRFYTIVWSDWLVRHKGKNSPGEMPTGEWCASFSSEEEKECGFHFNELVDRVVSAIVDANYTKEKIVWWSEFFYTLGNFGVVNFHLLFYLCSLVRGLGGGDGEAVDHLPPHLLRPLRRKIQICEQIYVLYLFKIGLLLNVSIYEAFDLVTSIITSLFNFEFFQFYMKKKKYHVEEGIRGEVQSFVNSVKEEAKNILTNYDVNVFIESIIHMSDCIFFIKSVKILILKSYCFVNVLLHVLSLKKVIIDMSNVECVDLLEGDTDNREEIHQADRDIMEWPQLRKSKGKEVELLSSFRSAPNDEEPEDSLPNWRKYDSAEESEKFSSSDSSDGHKVEDHLDGYGSFCKEKNVEKATEEALNNRIKNSKGGQGNHETGKKGGEKIWILQIFKYFDCHSFLCFRKSKTEEEHFYEKKKNFRNFFFPQNLKKWKKKTKKKKDQDLCKLVYTLKKRLIQNGNFLSMYKQAFYIKWTCLGIFILQKYRLKMFNSLEVFQYIYERMNSVRRTENFVFKIPADLNWGASFEGNADIRNPFLISLCHISRQLGALLRRHRKVNDQRLETEQRSIRDYPEELFNEEAKRQHEGEALFNEVNIYLNYFILSFYPYLIKSRFSYDIFLRLFRIYLNMYLITKGRNALTVRSPIYLLLIIFVHHTHVCKYVMFSYLMRIEQYLRSPQQSEENLREDSLPREALQVHFRESVEFFLHNCTEEDLQFDDVKITCDGNAVSLFYHMLVGNFS